MSKVQKQRVQTFGRKKTATAVAVCQQGLLLLFTPLIYF
jgi:ribosomal protein S9